jgi:predicted AlkP superfamily phosphohydrolase/phosphomutase
MPDQSKTVVIGLDGSNWSLIKDWVDSGVLPNLSSIYNETAHGVSRSNLPPVTCPNWKCYSTGKNPGKLGVYWWERIETESQRIHLPDSTDFSSPEIWDYLNDQGQNAGVINLPMTYPPRKIDQFMIAGGPRSREKNYTYPKELEQAVKGRFDYRVHPENVLTSNKDSEREVEMVHNTLRMRLRTAYTLLKEQNVDFLHVTLFHLNVLQHYFWDGEPTKRAYEIIDEELEQFIEEDYNLVLMSDHGCTEIDTVFYINSWLREKGYLQTESSLSSRLYDIGVTQEQVADLVREVGLEKYVRPLIPRAIIERFPSDEGVVREEKLSMVNWEHTTAIGSGQGLIYTVTDSKSKREQILNNLEKDLRAEHANGKPIAREVYRREDIYSGKHVDKAPEIIFDQRQGVHTSEAMGRSEIFSEPTNWRGENIPEGLVLFHGDDIENGDLDEVRITDIAPTILHWMGHPVPSDMDGEPILNVFKNDSEPSKRDVENRRSLDPTRESQQLDENIEDRLADIGYLE